VITTYRDHGLALARGMSCKTLLCELFGKEPGCSKGLGGSMHLFDQPNHMMGGHGIVGSHIPLAAGLAFGTKYRKEDSVTVCFFGEGAVPQGDFHEALSLAALWSLPIIFVCENNHFAMGTPIERTLSVEDITSKASGYGVSSDRFVVEDVLEVERRLAEAVKRARETNKPTLIECLTYRFRGHSMSDPAKYRTKEQVEEQKKNDPMAKARHELIDAGQQAQVEALEAEIEKEVQDAIVFADQAPEPSEELLESVTYVGPFAR
jgi:pyruvate dehydrogenase E1 component alpha subunit